MLYREFSASPALRPYVECYFTWEQVDSTVAEDNIYASGAIEIMFNLHEDRVQKTINGKKVTEPAAQFWGQTIRPVAFIGGGKHAMLGVRFFSHGAACFFGESIAEFNDGVIDFEAVKGNEARQLFQRLQGASQTSAHLDLLNQYFITELRRFQKTRPKSEIMSAVFNDLQRQDALRNISSLARSYGMSSRYLQKLCTQYSGLSPALYCKIARFRKSLRLVAFRNMSLTTIAHQLGYYDQPHFIRDFKYFTGIAPSHFQAASSTDFAVPINYY